MAKRLSQLFDLIENSKDCVVFTIKPETSPLDLVRLGGFEGHECMFRMSKNPRTTCITIFRDGDEPYHMSYGSSTDMVEEDRRKVRDLVMECVALDYGITFGADVMRDNSTFRYWVEKTSGERDLDSPREFELIKAPGGDCSLFVNGQHILKTNVSHLDRWLNEKDILLVKNSYEEPAGNGCTITRGQFKRLDTPMREEPLEKPRESSMSFSDAIDKALDSFMKKHGWQGLGAEEGIREFVRYAKSDLEPSLDDLMAEAKGKAVKKNAGRIEQEKPHKSKEPER